MAPVLTSFLLGVAIVGVALFAVQVAAAIWHLRTAPPEPTRHPGISVLKPLCGIDDQLEQNLESFAQLTYPNHEILLGVEHTRDPAYAVACRAASRCERMRVVVQHGAPGQNPKVNQLITLARAARTELLVVSDSNVAVEPRYLHEIAAHFERDDVGMVTHPIAGSGERRLGSLLDNVHLSISVGPGMIGANCVARQALVVGKSMAIKRADLDALGGFETVKDVLAEDYVMGRLIARVCKKRIAVAHRPVTNVSCQRSLASFVERYVRWNVLQRNAVGFGLYAAAALLNPLPYALIGFALTPSRRALTVLSVLVCIKALLELAVARAVQLQTPAWQRLLIMPLKDLLLFGTWLTACARSEVCWRGRRFCVALGTQMVPLPDSAPGIWRARVLRRLSRAQEIVPPRSAGTLPPSEGIRT